MQLRVATVACRVIEHMRVVFREVWPPVLPHLTPPVLRALVGCALMGLLHGLVTQD